jgi:hypothetical protein
MLGYAHEFAALVGDVAVFHAWALYKTSSLFRCFALNWEGGGWAGKGGVAGLGG